MGSPPPNDHEHVVGVEPYVVDDLRNRVRFVVAKEVVPTNVRVSVDARNVALLASAASGTWPTVMLVLVSVLTVDHRHLLSMNVSYSTIRHPVALSRTVIHRKRGRGDVTNVVYLMSY